MKNPRTHIEKEKALYTDYEIEMKVGRHVSICVDNDEVRVCRSIEYNYKLYCVCDRFAVFVS